MKSVPGKQLCQALESRGWLLFRINGSPHMYGKPGAVGNARPCPCPEART